MTGFITGLALAFALASAGFLWLLIYSWMKGAHGDGSENGAACHSRLCFLAGFAPNSLSQSRCVDSRSHSRSFVLVAP